MREPLIVTALFSIYVGTRGTAKAIEAIQKISPPVIGRSERRLAAQPRGGVR